MEKGDSEAQPTYGDIFQFKNTLKKYYKFCFDPLPRSYEKIQPPPYFQISITFLDYSYFFFQIKTTAIILNNILEALHFLYKNFK